MSLLDAVRGSESVTTTSSGCRVSAQRGLMLLAIIIAAVLVARDALAQRPADAPDTGAAAPFLEPRWPARWRSAERGSMGELVASEGRFAGWNDVLVGWIPLTDEQTALDDGPLLGGDSVVFLHEDENSLLFQLVPAKEDRKPAFTRVLRFISGQAEPPGPDARPRVRLQRTWLTVLDAAPDTRVRGVLLVIPGIMGTPEPIVDALVNKARSRGWVVLRMLSHPSRFTERWHIEADASSDESVDRAARRIADELGDRAAECAYAAHAALDWIDEHRPELAGLPRVALGMSGGAMAMPTVVARDPRRFKAAVLIAGGADYLSISARSNYRFMINAVRVDVRADGLTRAEAFDRIVRRYREVAPLDALHTAAALRDMPVLMIHATRDQAVPSDLGDLLWERLGKPERWTQPTGHEILFASLPVRFAAMFDWIDSALRDEPATQPARD